MKEELSHAHSSEIKWPKLGKVEVGPDVDFAYIVRKDNYFTMNPIAQRVAEDYRLDFTETQQILVQEYDCFFAGLVESFQWGYALKGDVEIHLYDPHALEAMIKTKCSDPIISLDPLMHQEVHEFKVSRGYYVSGRKDFSQIPRPGNEPLMLQAKNISDKIHGVLASVVEDDIFSGGSVIASINALHDSGIHIKKVVPGIQVGKPEKLAAMGIGVDPVVIYETSDGSNIFDKVDLGDPRDYLVGGSGLVVKLPNGGYGRSPYILPFVSVTARAGIPQELEKEFSLKVLQKNFGFFSRVEDQIGKPILLKHMDPDFMVLMHEMFNFDGNASMKQVIAWSMSNMDMIWDLTKKIGETQEKLASLELPQNIVFVDVNGTLFSDDSSDGFIPQYDVEKLKQAVREAKSKGVSVGICSDSPLPQLQILAETVGIDGPILAENGNILYHNGQMVVMNPLTDIELYKQQVVKEAQKFGICQGLDSVAREFGGEYSKNPELQWSFGANRYASVTVFGPSEMLKRLGEKFGAVPNISVDCSPQYNFLAIHPGDDYTQGKGKALSQLAQYNHTIVMIGNSMSDWVEPSSGVLSTFVANARITDEIVAKASYISHDILVKGVIDILNNISV